MGLILYVIGCIRDFFRSAVGGGGNVNSVDAWVGIGALAIIIAVFIITSFILHFKASMKYWQENLFSALVTVGFIIIACAVLIVVESAFLL